jgi:putative transcriptional regulator
MTGEELRQIREDAGLTQAALAYQLGVSLTTVSRWENGRAKLSPLAQYAISMWLKNNKEG